MLVGWWLLGSLEGRWGTYLTAPKRAPSHSFFRVSTVLSGRAAPVRLKQSKPASRSTKEKLRPREEGRDSMIFLPACVIVSCCSCEMVGWDLYLRE